MKKGMYCLVVVVTVCMVMSSICGPASGAPAKTIELKWSSFQSATSPWSTEILIPWAKMVEEKTGGKVKFMFYWGGSLVKGPDAYDAAIKGVCDVVHGPTAYNPNRFTLHEVVSLPGLGFPDAKSATDALLELAKKFPQVNAQYKEVKLLWIYCDVPVQLHTSRPVRTMNDIKGMKIRAPGSQAPYWKALGGVPVSMPGGEVYMGLQKKIIEGDAHTMVPFFDYKLYEVTKYTTMCDLYNTTFYEAMNLNAWNSLPPDVQKEIDRLSGAAGAAFGVKALDKVEEANIKKAKALSGHELIYLSKEEKAKWYDATRKEQEKWAADQEAKGLPGREILKETLRLAEKYK